MAATLALALAFAGAFGLNLGAGPAPAFADETPVPSITPNDIGWKVSDVYKGIAATSMFRDVPADATQIRVTVHRTTGGDVVKLSKPDAAFFVSLKEATSGNVTAPIYIQPGNRPESDSSSWYPATGEPWTAATVPTSVTVELLAGDMVIASANQANIHTVYATAAEVMPAGIVVEDARWVLSDGYKGIAVTSEFTNIPASATQIRVTLHRETGGDVVKLSRPDASFFSTIKTAMSGSATTPFMIQLDGYNESSSSSWFPAQNGVWTSATVPTSATIELLAGDTVIASAHQVGFLTVAATAAEVMPTGNSAVVTVPSDGPSYEVTVPEGATDVELAIGTPSGPGAAVVIPVEVTVQTQVGASVVFPSGVSVTSSDPAWDGSIQLPKVITDVSVPTTAGQSATVGVAIQLGSPTARVEFDAPVKLVLAGQAGQRAAYIQFGEFHEIATECPATAPSGMTTDECWVNEGDDLVIWTTHFTTFAAYAVSAELAVTGTPDMTLLLFVALAAVGVGAFGVAGARAMRTRRS